MQGVLRSILALALMVGFLAGCVPPATPAQPAAPAAAEPAATTASESAAPQAPAAAGLEQELVLYSAADQSMIDFAAKTFQEKTGIKVSTVTAGSGELLKRIESEKARPLGDVLWSVGPDTISSKPELFEPYKLKEADKLFPEALSPDNLMAPCSGISSATIMYNKKLVPAADVPKTWDDLLDPKWKGKIVNADPSKSSSSYQALVTRLLAKKGWDYEEKLIQNLVILPKSSMVYLQVGTGEAALGIAFEEGAYKYSVGPDATAGVVYPSDGTGVLFDVAALIKGAQHPNAAKAFLDFSVSAEFQKALIEKYYGRRAVRPDVTLPAGVPEMKTIKTLDYDLKWAADNRADNLKKYQDLMVKYNK